MPSWRRSPAASPASGVSDTAATLNGVITPDGRTRFFLPGNLQVTVQGQQQQFSTAAAPAPSPTVTQTVTQTPAPR